ncbi:MAG: TolC family protein, partial [Planctomycetes bacterium]|nr:TolC family protein [Planctomycetota bacterium]
PAPAAPAPAAPATKVPTLRSLSTQEALALALSNCLEIQVSRLGPEEAGHLAAATLGIFDPILFGSVQQQKDVTPNNLLFVPPIGDFPMDKPNDTMQTAVSAGLRGQLFQGLRYSTSYEATRTADLNAPNRDPEFFGGSQPLTPSWATSVGFQLTQPMLRGRGSSVVMAPIRIARKDQKAARDRFEAEVSSTILEVLDAYWNLVRELRQRDIQVARLHRGEALLEENRQHVRLGQMPPVEALQAEASVAQQREELLNAESAIGTASDVLKRLVAPPRTSLEEWGFQVAPTEEPITRPVAIDEAGAIRLAMERRTEIAALMTQIEAQELTIMLSKDQLLPLLDLSYTFRYNGLGGDLEGSYDSLGSTDYKNWAVGVVFEYPLGTRQARGQLRASETARRRLLLDLKILESQIIVQVRQAIRELGFAQQRIVAAQVAVELGRRQVEAEERRMALGITTSLDFLRIQEDLEQAETSALNAAIDHTTAVYRYQRAVGTLLAERKIEVR